MPKTSGKIIRCLEKDGKVGAVIQFNGKVPRVGEQVTIKWGAVRSNSQNALYWAFLGWLLDAGLKDEYGTTEELHESLKAAFLSKQNSLGLLKIGSTTELGKSEFGEYVDKVNLAMAENCGIDTSEFWKKHEERSF
jgi:hypothetical protein